MKQCLVIELWWLGDATLMTSAVRGLLEDGWKVTVLAKPQTRAFLESAYPQLDWIEFEAPWTALYGKYKLWRWPWRDIFRVLRELRARRFDASLSIRWDPREHFLLWLAGIRRRIGFKTPWSLWFLNEPISGHNPGLHRVEDWWEVQRRLGHPTATCLPPRLTADPTLTERFRARFGRDPRPVLAIHCGARIALRRWPVAYFSELISRLRREFDFQLALFPDLDGYGNELQSLADHTFTGLSTAEMLAALNGVAHLICNDSGPSHLADALGIPVIAIFGPGNPEKLRPFHRDNLVVIRNNCPYHPCSDYCRFPEPYCMTQLTPSLVWPEIRDNLLARGRIPRLASLSVRESGEAETKI
ncbi:MAG: glycosyltransferase family 9 protein [Methylacidiphilales bacterium]|nr:glycosyltransferase family 9 protein [Candidatus Methylacidiphilales bacterium]